jgi:hypothetical protein
MVSRWSVKFAACGTPPFDTLPSLRMYGHAPCDHAE